jgi:hypothetical protein
VNYVTINRFHTGDGTKKCEGLISTGLYQHPYELRNIFDMVSEESIIDMIDEKSFIGTVSEESINGLVTRFL